MLLVKTKLSLSKIQGIGLFAAQFIPQGTVIWQFAPGFDLELSKEDLLKLSRAAQEQALKYSYFDSKLERYILCSDDARFFNHSKTPNTKDADYEDGYGLTIAARDINDGEELTCNYESFDFKYDHTF